MNKNETIGTSPRPAVISEEPRGNIIALALLLAFLWGGNSLAIKVGLQDFPPMALAFLRFVIGLVVIGGWALFRRIPLRLRPGELPRLLLLTTIFILQIICLNTGTLYTSASRSTIFINVYPFFTALFAHFWIPGERLSVTKTLGIVVAFSGVFVTVAPELGQGETSVIGDIIVLVSGCFLGLRVVVTKLLIQSIHPYRLLAWLLTLSLPFYVTASLVGGTWGTDAVDAFRGISTAVSRRCYRGFLLFGVDSPYLSGIVRVNSLCSFLRRLCRVCCLATWILGDELTLSLLGGAALVAAGIYLVNMRR